MSKRFRKFIKEEKGDLKQFKLDWDNSEYEMPDFVGYFFEVRRERIKDEDISK